MSDFEAAYGDAMRRFAQEFIRYETTTGREAPAQAWFEDRLRSLGFETVSWEADPEVLADHPSFPSAESIDAEDRPSVGGVLEFGDPDAGPTLVLNGHADVVPAGAEAWTGDPFEPRWEGDRLIGRGAVDMKSQVAAAVFAARHLSDRAADLDGRVVVESVAGEEDGGIGAAAAALSNPYPFERDAAIVLEPTDMQVITATEGALMMRLDVTGREAHAARRWEGVSVFPLFEEIRTAFEGLESERADRVRHPLYERFDVPWPIVFGRARAGTWASNVAGDLTAELRIGVAPNESLDDAEQEFSDRLDEVVEGNEWLSDHRPRFERTGVQFESAEIDPGEPVVEALQGAMRARGHEVAPTGETYGADARHYIEAGIPAVVFGPGEIEAAHFPDESVRWPDVIDAAETIADAAERFLSMGP